MRACRTPAHYDSKSLFPHAVGRPGICIGTKGDSARPGAAPGSESWNYEEGVPQDASRPITNLTHPTLTAYFSDPALATGTAVIICPGGGFRELWVSHEGIDLAHWLNSMCVAAFI